VWSTFHASSTFTQDDLAKYVGDACTKVEQERSGQTVLEQPTTDVQRTLVRHLVSSLMKLVRPSWTLAKKTMKDSTLLPAYRHYLRNLWKYACGRVLAERQRARTAQIKTAKRILADFQKAKAIRDQKERKKRRGEVACAFFAEVLPKKAAKIPPLTEEYYRSLQSRFREVCGNDSLALVIRDLSGTVDATILRRLDRDHSGKIDFLELLKMMYPSILARDLLILTRKWETREIETAPLPTMQLLAEDSRRQVEVMFRKCDVGGKGVLTKNDMLAMFTPPDWIPSEPLWFEQHFPTQNSVVSFDEFVEMIKFCYPPFRDGTHLPTARNGPFKSWKLPSDVVAAQEYAEIED
jgi:Ca2+-binding EF-hand superfamily protein